VTDTRIGTPADHQTFRFKMNQDCGTAPYLAVNGGTSLQLCYKPAGSYLNFNSGELPNGAIITARYLSAYGLYVVEEWIDVFGGIKRFPSRLTTSDIPGGLISGKILATVDTSGTGSIVGGGYTTLRFTTATNTISTAGVGYYTLTKAGMLTYELRLIVASSRDMEIRSGLNGSSDFVVRKTDTEFIITGLMPVAIGEYIEFTVYNYGSSVSPTSGRLRAALLSI